MWEVSKHLISGTKTLPRLGERTLRGRTDACGKHLVEHHFEGHITNHYAHFLNPPDEPWNANAICLAYRVNLICNAQHGRSYAITLWSRSIKAQLLIKF